MEPAEQIGPKLPGNEMDRWIREVWDAHGGRCAGCGSDDHLKEQLVVPEDAGGRRVLANSTLLCRCCEMARAAAAKARRAGGDVQVPINVWISRPLYDSLRSALRDRGGFSSMGGLVRFMMGLLVEDPERFEDLANYQDRSSEVKINLWVDEALYARFKAVLADRGMTVTDGVKGLVLLYVSEGTPSIRREGNHV